MHLVATRVELWVIVSGDKRERQKAEVARKAESTEGGAERETEGQRRKGWKRSHQYKHGNMIRGKLNWNEHCNWKTGVNKKNFDKHVTTE